MNPLSKTVVYDLEASEFPWEIAPGKSIQAWGFNNQLPGPVLRANAGDTMLIRLTNHLNAVSYTHLWWLVTGKRKKAYIGNFQNWKRYRVR